MLLVVAGIVEEEGRYLIGQRGLNGSQALLWEFIGGKVEKGESPAEALIREFKEEIGVEIEVYSQIYEQIHTYPERTIRLLFLKASIINGIPQRSEHHALAWVLPREFINYTFCPADVEMASILARRSNCD